MRWTDREREREVDETREMMMSNGADGPEEEREIMTPTLFLFFMTFPAYHLLSWYYSFPLIHS